MNYDHLTAEDPDIAGALTAELTRQRDCVELIASENVVAEAEIGRASCRERV